MLPTLYDYYTTPSIQTGLLANSTNFQLNDKPITIYSGAIHYFRIPREYWRDRLRKLKAAGLNTVETYVPWNLHEETLGHYDFGSGGTDFQDFLDISHFLKLAQEEDLLAIVRPGPYICSEWDFGGLPSWLLKDPDVKIRRNDPKFLGYVTKYFAVLFKLLTMFQFTKGGPIIAFQVENEYGNVKIDLEPIDKDYLKALVDIFQSNGIVELLFTSDTPSNGDYGAIPGILNTANFQTEAIKELGILKGYQPDKPLMVMEFWSGWFDHWGEKHHHVAKEQFAFELENILSFPSSVNFYMFHGGTNWGFMNGANIMKDGTVSFDTSSYDYDAPLTENGDYTDKYYVIQKLIKAHNKVPIKLPPMPQGIKRVKYPDVKLSKMMKLHKYLDTLQKKPQQSKHLKSMEHFDQNYGYIIYSKVLDIEANAMLQLQERVRDTMLVLINGQLINKPFETHQDIDGFGYWKTPNSTIVLTTKNLINAKLDLIVENFGRVNYGKLNEFDQYRGLSSPILISGDEITDWEVTNLPFTKQENILLTSEKNVAQWDDIDAKFVGPALYKFELLIEKQQDVNDTFLDMTMWNKGIVIVNGFVLSRYFKLGPQQTCYLPGAFLRNGTNEIVIFEHFQHAEYLKFSDKPIFNSLNN